MPLERRESLASSFLSNPPSYRLPRFFGGADETASSSDSGSEAPNSSRSWISSPISANTTNSVPFSGDEEDSIFIEEQSALGDILLGRVAEKVGKLQFKKALKVAYDNKPKSKTEEVLRDKLYSFTYAETYYYSLMMREPSSSQRSREQVDLLSMYGSLLNHFSILATNLDELKSSYADIPSLPSYSSSPSSSSPSSPSSSSLSSSRISGGDANLSRDKPNKNDAIMWDDILLKEFRTFLQFRVHMITTYRYLAAAATGKLPNYSSLCNELHSMLVKCTAEISHFKMTKLVTNLKFELQVLLSLFRVQNHLSNLKYLESILGLWNCQSTLQDWMNAFRRANSSRDDKDAATPTEPSVTSSNKPKTDDFDATVLVKYKLYKWLKHFLNFSLSKATLYFHSALTKRELLFGGKPVSKFISDYQKSGIDYLSWIRSFMRWSRPLNVIFLADPEHRSNISLAAAVNGQGYRLKRQRKRIQQQQQQQQYKSNNNLNKYKNEYNHIDNNTENDNENDNDEDELPTSSGIQSWPCIYAASPLRVRDGDVDEEANGEVIFKATHWPNIISIIMDNPDIWQTTDYVHYHEQRTNHTYFVSCVDKGMYLCVLFTSKKKKNDKSVRDFMYHVSDCLRNSKVYAVLS